MIVKTVTASIVISHNSINAMHYQKHLMHRMRTHTVQADSTPGHSQYPLPNADPEGRETNNAMSVTL